MTCKECEGRGWVERQAFYTDGSPSREIEQAPCPACTAVAPDVMDLLDRLADEGERSGPPLPHDLSAGPWRMIKNRDARIAELEAELSDTRDGRVVVMPKSREHAGAMHLVAERYLRDNPVSK